jgi:biopolymer transport protein TolR
VVISVGAEGQIAVDDEVVTLEEAVRRARSRSSGGGNVYLRADKSVEYGYVLAVFDRLREEGLTGVSLVTKPIVEQPGRTRRGGAGEGGGGRP